jgi:prepilin-type N-terminal cleavage/methylation domain-containing protein
MKILKSNSGFTLIELMVMAAIIAVLSVGFGAFFYYQSRQHNHSEKNSSLQQLSSSVVSSVSKPDVLLQTESIGIEQRFTPNTQCTDPCIWDSQRNGCVYIHAQDTSQVCYAPPNLPTGCTAVCEGGGR